MHSKKLSHFDANTQNFYNVESGSTKLHFQGFTFDVLHCGTCSSTIHRGHTVAFPWQQWLRGCATTIPYRHIACLAGWFRRMTEEQRSVKSDERLGALSTIRHDKSAAKVCDFVLSNRRVSICEADEEAEIFYGSCHDNSREHL
jgi:hypothetical protein